MNETHIIWIGIAEIFFLILFFYLLYLIGGIYQNVKKILQKVTKIEGQLEKPT